MAKTITVSVGNAGFYNIQIRQQFTDLPQHLKELGYKREQKICIVTDTNVMPLYAAEVLELLSKDFDFVTVHCMNAGEQFKNLDTVAELYEDLILNHFDRHDLLLALGGGVVGDLTGFTAATYLRGIDFIQVPTTLLAQVDSSIGGKTGVDFLQYKNMVGAFYQPRLVYMNLNVLKTLPQKQIISGMGELLKHGLIKDKEYFYWMQAHQADIMRLEPDIMETMIEKSCQIKREVVERDEKEQGERALLNFGHTIGHAIEKLSEFSLSHGECVGIGMISAAYISWKLGTITQDDFTAIEETLASFGFQTRVNGFKSENVLKVTKLDKKMVGTKVKFVLLEKIGAAYINQNLSDEQILDGICYVCQD